MAPQRSTSQTRPYWLLHLQAQVWRSLMAIGMFLHRYVQYNCPSYCTKSTINKTRLAPPHPPSPSFSRIIPNTISPRKGKIDIQFYAPKNYAAKKAAGHKFPCLVNFHGGGFTLGSATDDARWAATVVRETGAIVASVNYRLAPEHPFPTAIEDGIDAIIFISDRADDLSVDREKIAISGFSAGGNMAFTVPLRLQEELDSSDTRDLTSATPTTSRDTSATTLVQSMQPVRIAAIVAWYPSADYTKTRKQRLMTMARPDLEMSPIFTKLFDESYLQPPTLDRTNPYLSPGLASKDLLKKLPSRIIMYTCEFDVLQAEASDLKSRLEALGKDVKHRLIKGVPHAWDKTPNPLKVAPRVEELYLDACHELRKAFRDPEAGSVIG